MFYIECIPGIASSSSTTPTSTSTSIGVFTSTIPVSTPTSTSTSTGFVKTSGQKFILDGEDYVVAGTNAYWLAQVSDEDIDTAFNDIVAAGLTTVRTM